MEPLFLAVIYGCQAGLLRDTLHEVYLPASNGAMLAGRQKCALPA
jgi:hypothetical protein